VVCGDGGVEVGGTFLEVYSIVSSGGEDHNSVLVCPQEVAWWRMVCELRTEEFGKQEVVRMGLFICLGLLFGWDPRLVYISQRLCGVARTELLAMPMTYRCS
jgi:hypothetical protein